MDGAKDNPQSFQRWRLQGAHQLPRSSSPTAPWHSGLCFHPTRKQIETDWIMWNHLLYLIIILFWVKIWRGNCRPQQFRIFRRKRMLFAFHHRGTRSASCRSWGCNRFWTISKTHVKWITPNLGNIWPIHCRDKPQKLSINRPSTMDGGWTHVFFQSALHLVSLFVISGSTSEYGSQSSKNVVFNSIGRPCWYGHPISIQKTPALYRKDRCRRDVLRTSRPQLWWSCHPSWNSPEQKGNQAPKLGRFTSQWS